MIMHEEIMYTHERNVEEERNENEITNEKKKMKKARNHEGDKKMCGDVTSL